MCHHTGVLKQSDFWLTHHPALVDIGLRIAQQEAQEMKQWLTA